MLEELDRPALKLLPVEPYVFAEWRIRRVGIDYHVDVERHYYSVPHRFAKEQVEVRLTAKTVEIFFKGERLAPDSTGSCKGKSPAGPDPLPTGPRRYAGSTTEPTPHDAAVIGPSATALCELILTE